MTAFFPTRTSNLSYTRISTLHRKMDCLALPTLAIPATGTVYRLILHRSVYYSIDKNCSFATHSNQYNSLRLEVSSSSSFLSIGITPYLTSILASPRAVFTVSQQVATPLHWVGSKHFVENIQFPMFMVWEQVLHRSP